MKAVNDLAAEYVRSILAYEPVLGVLRWRKMLSKRMPAGKIAGWIRADGRRNVHIDGRVYQASRLIWLIMTGDWPPFEIDHRDLDNGNDRWENLRLATYSQNQFNKAAYRNNSTGFKGVDFCSARGLYRARIKARGKRTELGYFKTAEEAARAYRDAAIREHGAFARF